MVSLLRGNTAEKTFTLQMNRYSKTQPAECVCVCVCGGGGECGKFH
jgi:hypothetical protein